MKSSSFNGPPPLLLILSGPSGAGKDYVLAQLKREHRDLVHITTTTTRERRAGEIDGVHYHFTTEGAFHRMIENQELLEYASVYGKLYGVPRQTVAEALEKGLDTIIKTDVQGAMTIRQCLPDAVLIFLMPPSRQDLNCRLARRNTEQPEDIERRLNTADAEFETLPRFDYVIVNGEGQIDRVIYEIEAIMVAEKLRARPRCYQLDRASANPPASS